MREITLAATFSALLIIGGHWFPFSRPPPWCCGRAAIGSHSL